MKTSITVDPDRWREFGDKLQRDGMDFSKGIDRLMEGFLNEPPREEFHELLDDILNHGPQYSRALQEMMELLAFSLRMSGRFSVAEIRGLRLKQMRKKDTEAE
ncbi:MAG: hypothetical protein JOZ62_17335 [Acidobacteriaceae bacterium]|nr:hypothetical protein [Acidobacteriaceae bacterium]